MSKCLAVRGGDSGTSVVWCVPSFLKAAGKEEGREKGRGLRTEGKETRKREKVHAWHGGGGDVECELL